MLSKQTANKQTPQLGYWISTLPSCVSLGSTEAVVWALARSTGIQGTILFTWIFSPQWPVCRWIQRSIGVAPVSQSGKGVPGSRQCLSSSLLWTSIGVSSSLSRGLDTSDKRENSGGTSALHRRPNHTDSWNTTVLDASVFCRSNKSLAENVLTGLTGLGADFPRALSVCCGSWKPAGYSQRAAFHSYLHSLRYHASSSSCYPVEKCAL